MVDRFVAGEPLKAGVAAVRDLHDAGMRASMDHLGEHAEERAQADANRDAYLALCTALTDQGLAEGTEMSVKLSAVGQALPSNGEKIALENARELCAAANRAGMLLTVDMEDHTTVDSTLGTLRELRQDFPWVGAVLQASLYRTEADCVDLAHAGSRVRLVKGAYAEPSSVAHAAKSEVDKAYVRCARTLLTGAGHPMIATHDPRMLRIAEHLAAHTARTPDSFEYQMLYGIRPAEQRRIADSGAAVRIYVPYGADWYGYFMRRLAERPANVLFFLRSLTSR